MEKQQMECPLCHKRACDIMIEAELPKQDFFVELKCPNCRNIVRITNNSKKKFKKTC